MALTRRLLPVEAEPARVLGQLRDALAGGPALLPLAARELSALPPEVAAATVPQRVCLVVQTSGSTARPKRVLLSADALLASAAATAVALDAQGHWLLALPVHYIAGIQVLVRSLAAETEPVVLPEGPFDPVLFARGVDALTGDLPRLSSLVPAQLATLVDAATADPGLARSAATLHAVLIGGQALSPALRTRAADLGIRVVGTYGATETGGGCVYDGTPLHAVEVREREGELQIAGPVLAEGYLADEERTRTAFRDEGGVRWYRTGDRGSVSGAEVVVRGRADGLIISGGVKVDLGEVEALLDAWPALRGAVVVATPHPRWGEVPVVVCEPASSSALPALEEVRAVIATRLVPAAAPAALVVVERLPRLGSGKPDRRALRRRVVAALGDNPGGGAPEL